MKGAGGFQVTRVLQLEELDSWVGQYMYTVEREKQGCISNVAAGFHYMQWVFSNVLEN